MKVDIAIIGAGVVGAAVAQRLSQSSEQTIVVFERAGQPGTGVSSRNSQVLHAGMYYPSNSLKAQLCVRGNRSVAQWCEAHRVPFARPGKLIVATAQDEEVELERLLAQGQTNGVPSLTLVDAAFVRAREPLVSATAALWSPDTGMLDVHALVGSLVEAARAQGVMFAFKHEVTTAVIESRGGATLTVAGPDGPLTVTASVVINVAGLEADVIARQLGLRDSQQYFVKGHYFRLKRRGLTHHVYPVPARHLAGLGVHVTVGLDGDVRLGPDVQLLEGREEDYSVPESLRADFVRGASRFLPGLTVEALEPDTAGIRPKLSRPGEPFRDFVIDSSTRGVINLVGIESPGLTCCLELADEVARLV